MRDQISLGAKSGQDRFVIRELCFSDYKSVIELQRKCFPQMSVWAEEQFSNQIRVFPVGQIGITFDGVLIASSSSLIVDYSFARYSPKWEEISGDGYIFNHNPKGDTLYGIEMMIDPGKRGLQLSYSLYDSRKRLAKSLNLKYVVIGGRIPGYKVYAHQYTPLQYIAQVLMKNIFDPVLSIQLKNGFVFKHLMMNYLPEDRESFGIAAFLEWVNPAYSTIKIKEKQLFGLKENIY